MDIVITGSGCKDYLEGQLYTNNGCLVIEIKEKKKEEEKEKDNDKDKL